MEGVQYRGGLIRRSIVAGSLAGAVMAMGVVGYNVGVEGAERPELCEAEDEIAEAGDQGGLSEVLANTRVFVGGNPTTVERAQGEEMAKEVLDNLRDCHEAQVLNDQYAFFLYRRSAPTLI